MAREPRPDPAPRRGRKRARAGWIAAAAVLIAASCLVAVYFLTGQAPAAPVGVVGNSSFFSDPRVLAYLARQGTPLGKEAQDLYSQGSWAICDDQASHLVANYDVANLGDSVEAQCVNNNLTRLGKSVEQHQFNAEPLVIVTRAQVERQLENESVVTNENGIIVFDVACYLRLISPGAVTAGIPVSKTCRIRPGGPAVPLVTVTDPTQSNSGSMFVAPDIISDDTLVSWDPAGNRLVEALTSPGISQLAERDGYRTDGDSAGFARAMTAMHYTVPDTLDPPTNPRFISNHASPNVPRGLTGQVMPGP